MIFPFNDYKDLFKTEAEQEAYLTTTEPLNNNLVDAALKLRLETNPDYEVFLPLVYYKHTRKLKNKPKVIRLFNYWISNKGRVLRKLKTEYKTFEGSNNSSDYLQILVTIGNHSVSMVNHRAVASVFSPIPIELFKDRSLHTLEVNHKDGNKSNPESTNLEWVTTKQNREHAALTGLSPMGAAHSQVKPLKGKVVRGSFKGFEFLIFGKTELRSYGFDQAATSNAVKGTIKSHGNCEWRFATEEEIITLPKGIPDNILEELKEINPWAKFIIFATCLATGVVIKGVGYQKFIKLGFSKSAMDNVFAGRASTHKNHSWARVLLD